LFTDIHSHLIWGVDDGAETQDQTFRMIHQAVEDGIARVICTPHITPGVYEFPMETFMEHFRLTREYIEKERIPLQLDTGAELLYTDQTPRLLREQKLPTLAGSNYVLVEFSPTDTKDHIFDAVQKVAMAGFFPVIAHIERYPAISKTEMVRELKSRFLARVQINARSLTRKQPLLRRRYFDGLFQEGLVDFVATDTHALPGRSTCMTAGMNALREKCGDAACEKIERITRECFPEASE